MSSDEECSTDKNVVELSDIDEQNGTIEIAEQLQEAEDNIEEVQRDETEGNDDKEADGEKQVVKPKRVVKNPQPRLNAETLKGSRGIASLPSYFERVKFKGKGHEEEDLNAIIKTYEYWCHRLFPKFPFEDCVDKLEKLGNKKGVLTHVKRIRFDLLLEEDEKPIVDSSDEEANVDGFVDINSAEISKQNKQFEQLLQPPPSVNQPPLQLTEEQQNRIRLNKERAEKLRQERLRKIRTKAEENLQTSRQIMPGPSGLSSQTDMFSDDESQNHDSEPDFDLESNLKGKSVMRRGTVNKSSTIPINVNRLTDGSDSDKSNSLDTGNMENNASENIKSNILGIDEDTIRDSTSPNLLNPKRKRKKNVIESDEENVNDDQTKENLSDNGSDSGLIIKRSSFGEDPGNKENSPVDNII